MSKNQVLLTSLVGAVPALGLLAVLILGGHWGNFTGVIWGVWGVRIRDSVKLGVR